MISPGAKTVVPRRCFRPAKRKITAVGDARSRPLWFCLFGRFLGFRLAEAPGREFILVMDNVHKSEGRWRVAGEVLLWVVYLFWAVWLFNAFLPPKPEQTPFEIYLGKQLAGHIGDRTGDQPGTSGPHSRFEQLSHGGAPD